MNMRELINLIEAPAPKQGVTGQKLAQTSGGQFMNRADRTNQAKVDAALGPGFKAGSAAANQALAKKFSQPQAVPAANTASAQQSAALDTSKANAIGGQQAATTAAAPVADTRGAAAMASRSAPVATAEPAATSAAAPVADTRGAAAMASRSAPAAANTEPVQAVAPAQTSDQIATAALNAQDSTPQADTRGAAAMASRSTSTPAQTTPDQIPTQTATAQSIGATNLQGENPAAPAQQNTAAPAQAGGYAQSATAATNNPAPKSDYQPVAGSSNLVSRTSDKIAADAKAGPGGQNPATKSYASFGDFASAVGNKVKGFFGGNQPAPDATAGTGPNLGTGTLGSTPNAQQPPAFVPSATTAGTPAAFGKVAEADAPVNSAPQQPAAKTQKAPSMYDVDKANRKEIASQFDPNSTYVNPHDKDTRASAPGSKAVNTMADFEEDVDHALAEMMRLSGLTLSEKAPPGKKAERMVKHIKKGYAKDGKLTDKEKSIAFATAWKQHNKEKVNEGMDIMLDEDGHTLKHIVNRFKHETKNFMNTGFMAENLYDALYDYYLDRGDMPYGIAKAREGDPYEWVEEHFYADMGSQMSEGAVAEQTVDPLSELARLAGLSEDGPGSAMLNAPKKDTDSFADRMRSAGKEIRRTIDRATLPAAMRADYDRIEAEKERASAPVATPAVAKADAFKDAMGSGSNKAQADDKLKEMGDSPLARLNQMPQTKGQEPSSGAASSFAPRERERVVSPKIDKYEKDKERAEKARRDIVDRESPDANTFGRKIGKAVSEPVAAIKSAWHGATDAWDHTMGNDTAPDPKPPVSVVNKRDWKGDKDNPALKENDELNRMRKIAGLQECGDMGMERDHMQQKDRLNVTTNMSSDGTKDVTINAQGDAAEDLLSMLKLAGMQGSASSQPAMVMIDRDEEMMEREETPVPDDGNVLGGMGDFEQIDAIDEANKKRITRHSNTPDEEYQTVDSILRQGNDLNREKRQYKKEYPGDNPMAESMLDQDLNDILESILIREEPIPTTKDPETGRVKATLPTDFFRPGKKRDRASQEIPMEPESPESRVTGPRSMKIPGERTGTENFGKDKEVDEGWEDVKTGVSNFVGDLFNTDDSIRRRSGQFRDLEAMQQKYKPGTPEYDQLEMRKTKQKERYYGDQGEVVGKDGEPIKVLPPDQWKGGK